MFCLEIRQDLLETCNPFLGKEAAYLVGISITAIAIEPRIGQLASKLSSSSSRLVVVRCILEWNLTTYTCWAFKIFPTIQSFNHPSTGLLQPSFEWCPHTTQPTSQVVTLCCAFLVRSFSPKGAVPGGVDELKGWLTSQRETRKIEMDDRIFIRSSWIPRYLEGILIYLLLIGFQDKPCQAVRLSLRSTRWPDGLHELCDQISGIKRTAWNRPDEKVMNSLEDEVV